VTPQTPPGFRITPQAVFGLVIIIAGLLMTADNLNWFEAGSMQSQCWKTPVRLRLARRSCGCAQATSTASTCSGARRARSVIS